MVSSIRDSLTARHRSVRDALQSLDLDALIITHLPNIFYLTGFTGTAAIVVMTSAKVSLLTDFRYVAFVEGMIEEGREWPDAALVRVDGAYDEALASFVEALPIGRVGFESAHLAYSRHQWLTRRLRLSEAPEKRDGHRQLVPVENVIERVRVRKDVHEVATLRAAATLLSEVARDVLRIVQPGPSEREFAAVIDYKLRSAGFARPAFDTIVAAGANSALPHARPGAQRMQAGDLLVLDFGGVYDGYCVDLTRTVCLGRPTEEMLRVYDAVAQAQRAALAAVRSGTPASAVDAAARTLLSERGLGKAFGHGTGHGLGVEVHEAPRVAPARAPSSSSSSGQNEAAGGETLEEGMVLTIEPGAYVTGWGGVRLEDDVLVTAEGCEVLTDVPRELTAG